MLYKIRQLKVWKKIVLYFRPAKEIYILTAGVAADNTIKGQLAFTGFFKGSRKV